MTVVWHRNDHKFCGRRVGIAGAGDSTGLHGGLVLGGNELCSFGAAAPDEHVMPRRSKASGQTATLGPCTAEDADLHAANVLAAPE